MESFAEAFEGYVQDDVDDVDRVDGSTDSTHSKPTTLEWIEGYSSIDSIGEDHFDSTHIYNQGRASISSDHSNATTASTLATTSTTSPPDSSSSSTGVGETWSIIQTPSPPASLTYDQSIGFGDASVDSNGNRNEFITLGTDGLIGFDQNGFHHQAYDLLSNGGEGIGLDALDPLTTSVFSGTGVKAVGSGSYGYDQYLLNYGLAGLSGLNQHQLGLAQTQTQLAGTYGTGPVYILDSQVQYSQYHQQLHQQQQQQAPLYPDSTAVFRSNVRDKKDWTDITSYAASMFVDNQGGNASGQPQPQQQQHRRSGSMTLNAGQGQFGSSGSGEAGIMGGSNFAQAFAGSAQQASEGVPIKGGERASGMFASSTGAASGFPVAHPSFGPVMGQSQYQHQQQASGGYYYSQATSGNGAFQPTFAGKVLPAYASIGAVVQARQPQQAQQSQQFHQQSIQAQPGLIVSPRTRPSVTSNTHSSVEDYHRAMAAQNVGEMQQLLSGSTVTQPQQQQQSQASRIKVEDDADYIGSTKTIENLVDELDAEVEAALAGPDRVPRGPTGKSKSAASNRLKSHRSRAPYHRSESTDAQSSTDRRQKSVSASASLSSSSSSPSEGTVISRNVLYEDGKPKIRNPFGGGRGYVPGETPDDPSKRHKCEICGRGFARLFNLKVSWHRLERESQAWVTYSDHLYLSYYSPMLPPTTRPGRNLSLVLTTAVRDHSRGCTILRDTGKE